MAGGNSSIQLRSKNSNSGIVTTASGGKLKSVTVAFNAATTDRKIDIYGKNTAYSAPSDLYGDEKGELLGSIAANDEDKTLTINGELSLRTTDGKVLGGGTKSEDLPFVLFVLKDHQLTFSSSLGLEGKELLLP